MRVLFLGIIFLFSVAKMAAVAPFTYFIDLNQAFTDEIQVKVQISPGVLKNSNGIFQFPKTVPGAYEVYDYGRFVKKLQAFDVNNKEIASERYDVNSWKIKDILLVSYIQYTVEDTWDSENKNPGVVFEPVGSNFEHNRNFVLNHGAIFGYFQGFEPSEIELVIDRPVDFYGSTSLNRSGGDMDTDKYKVLSYHELIDSPMMFCRPDTTHIQLGLAKIEVSVYSPNKQITSKEVAKLLEPQLQAQLKYLGYVIPVERYVFIFYFSKDDYLSKAFGALEHSRSSLFCLIEDKVKNIGITIEQIAAHEFFHIITPLYIHSEEVHNFNYANPNMSKHLWLYEGVVEYLSLHALLEAKVIGQDVFLSKIEEKMRNADAFDPSLSFTEMSRRCMEPDIASQYYNVYEKGALIGLCLDVYIMQTSKGKMNLRSLLRDLAKTYGLNKPFKDDDLFGEIGKLTNPDVKLFLEKFVSDTLPLPYEEIFKYVGINYQANGTRPTLSPLGGIDNGVLKSNKEDRFYIHKAELLDEFGANYIKFKQDDIILKWNGENLTVGTVTKIILPHLNNAQEGDPLTIVVLRKDSKGVAKEVTLSTTLTKVQLPDNHILGISEKPILGAQSLRKMWLGY